MPGIQLQQETKTKYYRDYFNERGFSAKVYMNSRDAMPFPCITSLPDSESDAIEDIKEFTQIVNEKYGAKSSLYINPNLLKRLPPNTISSGKGAGRYISKADATKAVDVVREKQNVAEQLKK